ncbi:MAG: cysteine desulfurase family protein [Candidatus Deferrimicrobiaceae bacterium]
MELRVGMTVTGPIYMDHNATTPIDHRVVDAMVEALRDNFGNAASRHEFGARAERAVKEARRLVAALIKADPEDIFFTSGATESNNLILWGAAARRGARKVLVTSEIEHPSILETAGALAGEGVIVRRAHPDASGIVEAKHVASLVDDTTFLVTVMLANNEIGIINPVRDYTPIAKRHGALFHSDATQAVGHIPVDVGSLSVDLLSFSAHKMYGPKGVGAIYAPRMARQRLAPRMIGGGHEHGLRSGTLNVPAIIGFGVAADIASREMDETERRVACLRNLLLKLLHDMAGKVVLNGPLENRLPGNLSVSLPGVDAEALIVRLKHVVAFSTGAACSSAMFEPSHVLVALSQDDDRAFSSVRFGIGRGNTEEEIRIVAEAVAKEVRFLRG